MSLAVEFFVPGRPRPKGSWRSMQSATTGKQIFVGNNKHARAWARAIAAAARQVHAGPPTAEPVAISCLFCFERPANHYRTRKGKADRTPEGLNAHGREYPFPILAGIPDVDKVERNVLDALTGVLFVDDRQVVSLRSRKVWGIAPGALVTVTTALDE